MRYNNFYSHNMKCEMKQINVRTAKNLFENGKEIFMQSSNMRFENMWQSAICVSKKDLGYLETFETLCTSYKWYNCDKERGKYIHFFVRVEDTK